ncbi:unnamed protein product [Paramecium sonneborni]|uniref:Uncharacterized protein n=1 Tax=Paramecium sonneborni TaxID=65129 RepID=A0A8S1KHE5_9CILI|nr:unnamed protein product [Paramecium sonneborni]
MIAGIKQRSKAANLIHITHYIRLVNRIQLNPDKTLQIILRDI